MSLTPTEPTNTSRYYGTPKNHKKTQNDPAILPIIGHDHDLAERTKPGYLINIHKTKWMVFSNWTHFLLRVCIMGAKLWYRLWYLRFISTTFLHVTFTNYFQARGIDSKNTILRQGRGSLRHSQFDPLYRMRFPFVLLSPWISFKFSANMQTYHLFAHRLL